MNNRWQNIFLALLLILLPGTSFSQDDNTKALDQQVTISVENVTAEEIIKELAHNYQLFFAYNPEILPVKDFSFSFSNIKTINLLRQFLPEDKYRIEEFDGQIIISLIEHSPLRFEGILIDKENQKPVPYASIAVMGEGVGTISNSDGIFELVIPERFRNKLITIGCLGYRRTHISPDSIEGIHKIELEPFSYKLREIKVEPVEPEEVIGNMRSRIKDNYSDNYILMTSFYRETLQKDGEYIGVWEAVMELLKSPCYSSATDKVRIIKGRKNDFNKQEEEIQLKMEGGPWYITKLDIVKTDESFINPQFLGMYKYSFEQPVIYNGRITWVISFSRDTKTDFPCFKGNFLVDAETSALVMADYSLDRKSLKTTGKTFIRKEPRGIVTTPVSVDYHVSYRLLNGKWHLHTARTDVRYKVKKKDERFRAEFRSVSDLLITNQYRFPSRAKFRGEGMFHADDIFSELINDYDPAFWENYNIIKPDEDLKNALKESLSESHDHPSR